MPTTHKFARTAARARTDSGQYQRVLETAKELSATLGNDFFQSLVKHLAEAFRADCVWVGELCGAPPDRMRTLTVWRSAGGSENFEQKLSGTAAGQAILDGAFSCSKDAWRLFPLDDLILTLDAEGYVGVRLTDTAGQPLGLLAVVSKARFSNLPLIRAVVETFVARAAGELERKRDEDLHRENEERYRAFISTNPDAMWRVEFEQPVPLNLPEEEQIERAYRLGYVAECNDAAAQLVGLGTAGELTGARFEAIAPKGDPRVAAELRSAVQSEFRLTTVETAAMDDRGNPCYRLRTQFGIVEKGELRRIWFTTRDVTELRQAELNLVASEARFRAVLEGIQLPAVMLGVEGTLTFANECFLQLARRSWQEAASVQWLEGIVPPGESEAWKVTLLPDEEGRYPALHFEGALIRPQARPLVIVWDTIALRRHDGQLAGLAAIGRDVTRQRALETEIRQAEKLESVGRLAAGVAHDFNNLLTVVLGRTAQLLARAKENSLDRECLTEIDRVATQCAYLTGELLAFSRKQHLRPKLVNLNEVIAADERIIRSLAGDSVEVVMDMASPLGLVYVDPRQIERTITNLVTNAREAMPEGGRLTIATSRLTIGPDDLALAAVPPGNYIRLSVSDTGVGVTDEIRAHLFEPFFTTKRQDKGTGLGLATVYGIVTQNNGYINVYSEPGRGTRFDLLFPAAREA